LSILLKISGSKTILSFETSFSTSPSILLDISGSKTILSLEISLSTSWSFSVSLDRFISSPFLVNHDYRFLENREKSVEINKRNVNLFGNKVINVHDKTEHLPSLFTRKSMSFIEHDVKGTGIDNIRYGFRRCKTWGRMNDALLQRSDSTTSLLLLRAESTRFMFKLSAKLKDCDLLRRIEGNLRSCL
jgi:hypothetical protein